MGCDSSKLPDPSVHDEPRTKKAKQEGSTNSQGIKQNRVHPEQTNGTVPAENETNSEFIRRSMKGDLTMYSEAKIHREKTMKERLRRRELQAGEISERAMEEKEWLSLTSTRSRATSRVGSPRNGRGANSTLTATEVPIALSPSEPRSPTDTLPPLPKKDHSHKVKSSSKIKSKTGGTENSDAPNGHTQITVNGHDTGADSVPQNERNNNTDNSAKTEANNRSNQDTPGKGTSDSPNDGLPPIDDQ